MEAQNHPRRGSSLLRNVLEPTEPRKKCPECGSTAVILSGDTGELVCGSCGLVLTTQRLSQSAEWRAFTQEERAERVRVGSPTSILKADKGLSTTIRSVDKDAYGRSVPYSMRRQMLRLKRWQSQVQYGTSAERNLLIALSELDRMSDKLRISRDIQERAAQLYRKALETGLVRGRSIASMASACLYAACRSLQRPRSLKEVASASKVRIKEIARCYRLILRELQVSMPIPEPKAYISKIAAKLSIPEKTQIEAAQVLNEARRKRIIAGKDPKGMAAAALYVACVRTGVQRTQKDIANAAEVTEVTVRNRYKGLKEAFGSLAKTEAPLQEIRKS